MRNVFPVDDVMILDALYVRISPAGSYAPDSSIYDYYSFSSQNVFKNAFLYRLRMRLFISSFLHIFMDHDFQEARPKFDLKQLKSLKKKTVP